ncbi:MAG: hypothetical protein ABWZ25_15820 [Chitinophagaceae bacterium]
MQKEKYVELGTDWQTDDAIECCTKDPGQTPTGCDCCYDSWVEELKKVKQDFGQVNEDAIQLNEQYKQVTAERDKLKSWLDDLDKADDLSRTLCNQVNIMTSQTEKICINTDKSTESIGILFCMVKDFYEQTDLILTLYNDIIACIKCLNSDELTENSGIVKCLTLFYGKLDAVIKTRNEVIKAIMTAIKQSTLLHEQICSEFGLKEIINEWNEILACDEECGSSGAESKPGGSCKDGPDVAAGDDKCKLVPVLTLRVCNDPYYKEIKDRYEQDKQEVITLAAELLTINKKREALAACQNSLIAAIKETNPKELCK